MMLPIGAGSLHERDSNKVITEPVDGLAPKGVRPSAGIGLTIKLNLWLFVVLHIELHTKLQI